MLNTSEYIKLAHLVAKLLGWVLFYGYRVEITYTDTIVYVLGGIQLDKAVGCRIKSLREQKKYSREVFAEKIQISTKFLYEIENREKGFSADVLKRMSSVLDISSDYILFGENNDTTGEHYLKEVFELERAQKKYLREILSILKKMN